MPLLVEDPASLSKSRLKSDLIAHNVALPPGKSKKEVYVALYLKHIGQKSAANFSSDEEEPDRDVAEENPEVSDPGDLTDDDLKAALLKHGVKAGPIVASTRALYERKLLKALQPDGHIQLNEAEKGVLYSDSEDEKTSGEEDDAESDFEGKKQTGKQSDQAVKEHSQIKKNHSFQNGDFYYPQCFLPSSRLNFRASSNREPKWNLKNALKSSERSQPQRSQVSVGIRRASFMNQHSGLGPGMEIRRSLFASTDAERELCGSNVQEYLPQSDGLDMPVMDEYTRKNESVYDTPKASPYKPEMKPSQEPVKDAFKDMVPATEITPTGIYASCRRPIKGAAGRPVQYAYSGTPASPTTLERREVACRLVPIHIQLLVFLIVACLLYFIYVYIEDNPLSPLVALLETLNQGLDGEDGLLLQTRTQDTPALSG